MLLKLSCYFGLYCPVTLLLVIMKLTFIEPTFQAFEVYGATCTNVVS